MSVFWQNTCRLLTILSSGEAILNLYKTTGGGGEIETVFLLIYVLYISGEKHSVKNNMNMTLTYTTTKVEHFSILFLFFRRLNVSWRVVISSLVKSRIRCERPFRFVCYIATWRNYAYFWRPQYIYNVSSSGCVELPVNTIRWPNVDLMLGQRPRRWPNLKPTLGQYLAAMFVHYMAWCQDGKKPGQKKAIKHSQPQANSIG